MMLRSLQKASTAMSIEWHFGLAASYIHTFTSPIRRLSRFDNPPDYEGVSQRELDEARIEHYADILPDIAKQSSEREKNAEEAEREYENLKKAEYMRQHVGETFTGVISGITSFGNVVELENTLRG
jgi:ribonuclease R